MAQKHAFALCRARGQLLRFQYACKIYLLKDVRLGMAFCHVTINLFASVLDRVPPSSLRFICARACHSHLTWCYEAQ